jgi:hypothetical protein
MSSVGCGMVLLVGAQHAAPLPHGTTVETRHLPIRPSAHRYLTVAPTNPATAASVVCAAFRPSRKSLSL